MSDTVSIKKCRVKLLFLLIILILVALFLSLFFLFTSYQDDKTFFFSWLSPNLAPITLIIITFLSYYNSSLHITVRINKSIYFLTFILAISYFVILYIFIIDIGRRPKEIGLEERDFYTTFLSFIQGIVIAFIGLFFNQQEAAPKK